MNKLLKDLLKLANKAYSEGKVYILTDMDLVNITKILHISINKKELTDEVYDIIYYKAKELWPNDTFFKELQAENSGYGKEIIHSEPMGSMDELKEGDWDKWKVGHQEFLLTEKLDGCSIILTYQNGKLYSAATRGRGIKGKDIMRHIPFISNIPQVIADTDTLVVRGELLCPKSEISEMLQEVAEIEGKEQKNGRNTVAGTLNRKESNKIIFKHLHFVSYWNSKTKGQDLIFLTELGFETPWSLNIKDTITEEELIKYVKKRIDESKYEIDGIILTQLDNSEEGFITGTINPKCSRKFKIGIYNNIAESEILGVEWNISKNYKLKPVVLIKPVELCGVIIKRITGNNANFLDQNNCHVGQKILIARSGLVIPKILKFF